MEKVTRFEDLHCWQSARALARKVFVYSKQGELGKDWDTRSQFRRAGLSVMNNIAEGFTRFSDREKIRFLEISTSSGNEVKSMLYLFEDLAFLPQETILELHQDTDKAINQTMGLIRYLYRKGK
ncbi:MAG: four helix bundle protein [Lewinellaceae bacterium]|nr:four helix bundle protein [Lewinellaceae bacterium]MCB9290666.1 four helix bundle protein [Lewinellaceae bacterium]